MLRNCGGVNAGCDTGGVSSPFNNTVAVAMSGGVDSSTVAAMLRGEGYELVGLTLQLWNQRRLAGHEGMPESVTGRCCGSCRRRRDHTFGDIVSLSMDDDPTVLATVVLGDLLARELAARLLALAVHLVHRRGGEEAFGDGSVRRQEKDGYLLWENVNRGGDGYCGGPHLRMFMPRTEFDLAWSMACFL